MPNLLSAVLADPHTREVAKREVKTQALFQFVLENMINLEEMGLSWRALNDPAQMQNARETLMQCCSRLGTERLGALLAAAKRWRRYATEEEVDVKHPAPYQVAAFLRQVSSGGPTAGASMYQALRWYEENFGVVLHSSHFLVRPFRFHQLHHTGKQQKELEPWEFCNLIRLAQRGQGTKQILASFVLQAAIVASGSNICNEASLWNQPGRGLPLPVRRVSPANKELGQGTNGLCRAWMRAPSA